MQKHFNMNMYNILRQWLFILAVGHLALLFSCTDEEVIPPDPIAAARTGVFIINEGNFGGGNGSVKFVGTDNVTIEADTLEKAFRGTNNRSLGDVVQSMAVVNDSIAYIVVNNDNKVEVMKTTDFSSVSTVNTLHLPRYALAVSNDKAYITNWGTFDGTVPAYIAIMDLNTHTVTDTIGLGSYLGSDRMYLNGGKVYVMNNFVNTVTVVDVASDQVENTIEVGDAPSTAVIDGTSLLVLCAGSYGLDFVSTDDDTPAQVNRIDMASQTVTGSVNIGELGDHPSKMALAGDGNNILLAHAGAIWQLPIATLRLPSTPFISELNAYGLGVAPNGEVYVGDAGSFTSVGTVYRYTAQGQLLENYSSGGVGPNGFVWME